MYKILDAVRSLQAGNPLGLPIIRSVHQAVPVKGTSIRSGVFFVITEREALEFGRRLAEHPRLRFGEGVAQIGLLAGPRQIFPRLRFLADAHDPAQVL